MSEHKEQSRPAGTEAASGLSTEQQASTDHDTPEAARRPPNKVETMLRLFAAGRRLNRFEAERHGDHVLPSTVSEIQGRYGLTFARELETVPGRNGTPTQCARYWLPAEHLWAADRKQTTVLEFDRPSRNGEHPTMKPVALFEYQMLNNTKGGDIVLDSFGGSGTTLIAAEKNGRHARLMELDPRYVDVIVRRWQDFTGKAATLEADGRTFAEAEAEQAPTTT